MCMHIGYACQSEGLAGAGIQRDLAQISELGRDKLLSGTAPD